MEPKAEKVVQNIGAVAETISVFYNSIARQVPKDVAVELTKHFMSLTISRTTVHGNPAMAAAALEAQKRILEQRRRQQEAANGGASAANKPGTPALEPEPEQQKEQEAE